MQDAYMILGQVLAATCAPEFEMARIEATLDDDHTKAQYICLRDNQETTVLPKAGGGSKVHDALHQIRDTMTLPGQKPWSKCTFTLFPDGQFKFDVEYDD